MKVLEAEEKLLMDKMKQGMKPKKLESFESELREPKRDETLLKIKIGVTNSILNDIEKLEKGTLAANEKTMTEGALEGFKNQLTTPPTDRKQLIALFKQHLTDTLSLLKNFEQQLSLKNNLLRSLRRHT